MPIDKKTANHVLTTLERCANQIETLVKDGKIDPRIATPIVKELDGFSDRFEVSAYGKDNLRKRMAKVLKRDPDEKFMDTFDNPVKPIKTDADEEYMHKMGPSFNGKGMDTFDADRSSTVTERDEYAVRDLSEWADPTKKQPSWSRGPAGKSTRNGSVAPAKSWSK